jgi:hypothetical protein
MELDELKSIWKKNNTEFQQKDEAELASMMKGSSKSIVEKLKRNVWFEFLFTLVAGVGLLIYALTLPSGSLKWTSVSVLVLLVVYSFYYIKKLLLLNRFNAGEDNLKENLKKLIDNLTSYLNFYKRSYTILYPLYFCLGLLFGAVERGADDFFHIIMRPKMILYLTSVAVFFAICSTWLTKWYLKKLYGNHLEKLNGVLYDLEEHETPSQSESDSLG